MLISFIHDQHLTSKASHLYIHTKSVKGESKTVTNWNLLAMWTIEKARLKLTNWTSLTNCLMRSYNSLALRTQRWFTEFFFWLNGFTIYYAIGVYHTKGQDLIYGPLCTSYKRYLINFCYEVDNCFLPELEFGKAYLFCEKRKPTQQILQKTCSWFTLEKVKSHIR